MQCLQSIHTCGLIRTSLCICLPRAQQQQRTGTKVIESIFQKIKEVNILLSHLSGQIKHVLLGHWLLHLSPDSLFTQHSQWSFGCIYQIVSPYSQTLMTDPHHIQNKTPNHYYQPLRPVSSGPWLALRSPLPLLYFLSPFAFLSLFEHIVPFVWNLTPP